YAQAHHGFPSKLHLDLRGTRFEIERDTLISLPESILIVMFPNGLMLRPQASQLGKDEDDLEDEEEEEQVIYVDFDPACLQYILDFYRDAHMQQQQQRQQQPLSLGSIQPQNPFLSKQAIIVLREELDYFAIPPPSSKDLHNMKPLPSRPLMIKTQCGRILLEDRKIFTALQRNIDKEKNQAEQHLMDMLCVSGFQRDGEWGYRRLEPKKTTVVSVAMVMLRTTAAASPAQTMAIAQKLLLFWRKPARKCWWDGIQVEIDQDIEGATSIKVPVRLWARRTWTLELVFV
ncbi:hypothetical protein B0O80DRAFT_374973, partial [Mortierella sp. GBAus27b]